MRIFTQWTEMECDSYFKIKKKKIDNLNDDTYEKWRVNNILRDFLHKTCYEQHKNLFNFK